MDGQLSRPLLAGDDGELRSKGCYGDNRRACHICSRDCQLKALHSIQTAHKHFISVLQDIACIKLLSLSLTYLVIILALLGIADKLSRRVS